MKKISYVGNGWPNPQQLALLKAALLTGPIGNEAWARWSHSIDLDQMDPASYKLLPLLVRNRVETGLVFEKSKGVYRKTWVENHVHWQKMRVLFEGLIDAGVSQIVLLKGMALLFSTYRDFGMRVMGDIDILVEKKDLQIAIPFLLRVGWTYYWPRFDFQNEAHLTRYHALNFTHPEGGRLDLHWSFIQENSAWVDRAVFQQVIPLSMQKLYVPCPSDLLLQALVHGVKYSAVPLIRWIGDAVTLIRNAPIDWDRLCEMAIGARVVESVFLALQYLEEQFEVKIPPTIMERLKQHPLLRIERLESWFHARGYPRSADWCRYCLNRGHVSLLSQILQLPRYWQATARLRSLWQIPVFAPYWIFKRFRRRFIGT